MYRTQWFPVYRKYHRTGRQFKWSTYGRLCYCRDTGRDFCGGLFHSTGAWSLFLDGPLGKQVPNKDAHEPAFGMRAPATLLAIFSVFLVGLLPALLVEKIVNKTTKHTNHRIFALKVIIWRFWHVVFNLSSG